MSVCYCKCTCLKETNTLQDPKNVPVSSKLGQCDLSVKIRYIVFTPGVTKNRILSAHQTLEKAFTASNNAELQKVPSNQMYPWKERIGNPDIHFETPSIEYPEFEALTMKDGDSPLEVYSEIVPELPDFVNVYVGNTVNNLLGEAVLRGKKLFVYHACLGGIKYPGDLEYYNQGKTLIHEIGHVFGLDHPFSECDVLKYDIPAQINPNYNGELFLSEKGWDCRFDNKYLDRIDNKERSCNIETNEMFLNYMDYAKDEFSIMFTNSQAAFMHDYVANQLYTIRVITTNQIPPERNEISKDTFHDIRYHIWFAALSIALSLIILYFLRRRNV